MQNAETVLNVIREKKSKSGQSLYSNNVLGYGIRQR